MESGNGDTVSVGDNIRRLAKKVRRRPEEPLDLDDPVVNDKGMKLDSINVRTVSWKYKLLNTTIERINLQNEEDIELLEEDEKKFFFDGIPSITFFERVHQFIAKHMTRIVVVELLGRKISYLTMANKLQAIWKIK
ncbi:hypothetical protein ES332_D06G126300v1 [Gossypium tomentosum]|uniref:Uncharacterized protein n=1 Tax=Gossypium tomentosum TaxID=34277 RepID=A0A5D2KH71_GOSTO|nr:hypothetical protein ES332_D06G126300v1 [Gossypium tomentosum]